MEDLANQLEASSGLEMSIATIDRIEKGRRGVYDYEIVAFAQVFNIDFALLLLPQQSVFPPNSKVFQHR
jgi:hypothetical protein